MDREREILVAVPFKKRGKRSLKLSDFIFTLSLDLKWGPPENVRALLREAESEGMVRIDRETETVHAEFNEKDVEIPLGFKPTSVETLLEKGIRLITTETGLSRKEAIAMANEKQDQLQRLVELDAVVLLVAREMGLEVRALAEEGYRNLLLRTKQEEGGQENNSLW